MSDDTMLAMNTIIPEESSVADIDGESTNKNAPTMMTEDDRMKVAGYFRFVETVEEAKMIDKQRSASIKPSFIKDYSSAENNDWTENHYFYDDGKEDDECKVLFTSYQVKRLTENCSRSDAYCTKMPIEMNKEEGKDADFYYIQAQKPCNTISVPNIPQEGDVHDYLMLMKKQFDFEPSCPLEDVLESLSEEELATAKVDELPCFAKTWRKSLVDRDLTAMLKPIFDWQGGALDKNIYEMILGLGHVRMIYPKNKHSDEQKILNAPLIEVPVDVDNESLKVVPVPGGRLKWNGEVKAALLFTEKGKHKKILDDFQTLVVNGDPMNVNLGNPKSFLKYVEKASQFSWSSQLKEHTDDSLHQVPEKAKIPVLTTEWCLFVRQKRSNIISDDAREIANVIEENKLNLSLPCRSLILGLDDADSENNDRKKDSSSLSFRLPLPASKNQLQVIQNVFSKNSTVTIIRGPPG